MPNETEPVPVPPYIKAMDVIEKATTEAEIMEAFEEYDSTECKIKRRADELTQELDELGVRKRQADKELNELTNNAFFYQVSVQSVAAEKIFKLRLAEHREI